MKLLIMSSHKSSAFAKGQNNDFPNFSSSCNFRLIQATQMDACACITVITAE